MMNSKDQLLSIMEKNELDTLLIFNSDQHINENIRECDRLVMRFSGFKGSNGTLMINKSSDNNQNKFLLFTDSRYTIMAKDQSKIFLLSEVTLIEELLLSNSKKIGFDYRTISHSQFDKIESKLPPTVFIKHLNMLNRFSIK